MNQLMMKQISKSFSGVQALNEVSFQVAAGEIHALLGANGAGKSTLMKILSGAYTADAGSIVINGQAVHIRSPKEAITAGVQCVYQEVDTALVPELSVAENIMLDRLANSRERQWVNWGKYRKEAQAILERMGTPIGVHKLVSELDIAGKQLVLIARALVQQAKYIIFDEPTAPLSLEEADKLFAVMQRLRQQGVGCIFISHRLQEVFSHCDRITVMRDGQVVLNAATSQTDIQSVIHAMLGKSFEEEFPKMAAAIGKPLLQATALHCGRKVRGVSLTASEGEIVGIVGLVGAGKTELSRALFGADRLQSGEIRVDGKLHSLAEPYDAVAAGIVLVPEERRKQGILIQESIMHNLTIPSLSSFTRLGFIRRLLEKKHAEEMVDRVKIKAASVMMQTGHLSGGNQQKVAIGKWLPTEAKVYLFDEPTKGIDVGGKSEIFRLIGKLAQEGKAILYFSSEIEEILGIADRILVMCEGKIAKELSREEATRDAILYFASALKEEEA